MRFMAFVLLTSVGLYAQGSATLAPKSHTPLSACLYYTATGQRALIPGVAIDWEVNSWTVKSGGHLHDTDLTRPLPTTRTPIPQLTDTSGCVTYMVDAPYYAGQFASNFVIEAVSCASHPNVVCTPAGVTLYVQENPYQGGTFQGIPSSGGHTFYNDPGHSPYNMFLDNVTGSALKFINDLWASSYATLGDQKISVIRGSLYKGGYLDGILTGAYWNGDYYTPGGNQDPHEWGYSVDIRKPQTQLGRFQWGIYYSEYCPGPVYDQATHAFPTSTSVYWHLFCNIGPGEINYPN